MPLTPHTENPANDGDPERSASSTLSDRFEQAVQLAREFARKFRLAAEDDDGEIASRSAIMLLKIFKNNPRAFDPERALMPLVKKVTMNKMKDYFREQRSRRARETAFGAAQALANVAAREDDTFEAERLLELKCVLRTLLPTLPPALRDVLILRAIEQRSYKEIARARHTSVETVKSQMVRVARICQERLHQYRARARS